jgi:hypothetical protein
MAVTSVDSSASSAVLLAADSARKGASIQNTDANALHIIVDSQDATTTLYSVKLNQGDYWETPASYRGQEIRGIWAANGSGAAVITEYD